MTTAARRLVSADEARSVAEGGAQDQAVTALDLAHTIIRLDADLAAVRSLHQPSTLETVEVWPGGNSDKARIVPACTGCVYPFEDCPTRRAMRAQR
jgi:hypothetical protein